jgi:hypothetical protein
MTSQEEYRSINHYRQALVRDSGELVYVDDVTFDINIHEEVVAEEAVVVDE